MKILITTVTRMSNRGVDALVASKAAELRKTFPGASVEVLTTDPEVNEPFLQLRGLPCHYDPYSERRYRSFIHPGSRRWTLRKLTGRPRTLGAVSGLARGFDLAVATGGDNMSSDYGTPSIYLAALHQIADEGVPIAMLGQSIGPFRHPEHRESFIRLANRCALITVRETASLAYVLDDLKLPKEKVRLTADVAFLLEPSPSDWAGQAMASFGIDLARPVIALSVSGGIAGFAGSDGGRHVEALERMTRRLMAETGAQVLLIPHVEDHRASNNDLIACDALMRAMGYPVDLRLARGFFTSNDYKAIVARCDMVIAERMHVAIAGLSSGLPVFVIGYSVKGHGIMSDCFGVDSRAEGLVTPLQDFMDDPAEDEKILSVWARRAELGASLRERLPALKARAAENFSLLPAVAKRA
ncbi:polysaccharide pyruvyl transferase family protein [Frigidibacter sp. MR17.14]|uniref:polysaccharide pyruvyl transferase family protein n=1 Tax=Frigidibacter sp. MR17.14 TaxID=3126509 RepID=UPI00301315A3